MPNLNTKQVMALTGVSHVTIYLWRAGSESREPLPAVTGARPNSVEFVPTQLRAWAKKYGIGLKHDPVEVAKGAVKLKIAAPTERVKKTTTKKRARH